MKELLINSMRRGGIFSICLLVSACATLSSPPKVVQEGETVKVCYTCKNKNGKIITSNEASVMSAAELDKSEFFLANQDDSPLILAAGRPDHGKILRLRKIRPLGCNEEIAFQLAQAVVGLPVAVRTKVTLSSKWQKFLKPGNRYLRLARVRRRPKLTIIPKDRFMANNKNNTPQLGDEQPSFNGFVGKIVSITNHDVVIENIPAEGGNTIQTAFGKGIVSEHGNQLKIDIDVHQGDLVRTGTNFGRIDRVDDTFFYVDYGHPYGGETLSCDVTVKAAPPATAQY